MRCVMYINDMYNGLWSGIVLLKSCFSLPFIVPKLVSV